MDLLSFIFFLMLASCIFLIGLGIIWEIRGILEPYPVGVFLREQYGTLGTTMFITMTVSAILLVLHITNVITMWEVGYALAKL